MEHYDVIVIGAGHAGIEAANISEKYGLKTALITKNYSDLGKLSCNPSIGGVGKTHIASEVDILGGVICKIGDKSAIHYRVLNLSKGPAVWGVRAQIDRDLYSKNMQQYIKKSKIDLIEDEAINILEKNNKIIGVHCLNLGKLKSKAVILTTGTFLNGKIYFGTEVKEAGRIGNSSSKELAKFINKNFRTMRLKTGTPPRIYNESIDYSVLEPQPSENHGIYLSYFTKQNTNKNINCYITKTNNKTHKIIRDNLDKSAMYSGIIKSQGVRYCPSIEDKITKFGDRNGHNIFLEPEGLNSDLVYPNGISNSLDKKIQLKFLRSIKGLEKCEVDQYGYAVEYDSVDPRELKNNFETKKIENFFLAGQINGTTGYEEAAGQGIYAAIQVAMKIKKIKFQQNVFNRDNSYIGVLVDDLTKLGVTEPYRMFTSRAENRLKLRTDNSYERFAVNINSKIFNKVDFNTISKNLSNEEKIISKLKLFRYSPNDLMKTNIKVKKDGKVRNGFEVLKFLDLNIKTFESFFGIKINQKLLTKIYFDSKYEVFYQREKKSYDQLNKNKNMNLKNIDFNKIPSLSKEILEKLNKIKPENLYDAGKISGITPSALFQIIKHKKVKGVKVA
ncbi:tRNA uridine-5-carboxymethylaminomethyl(34) synthesis enzyme MnmG [Alphaproteobacteria bacterium]|nr:tRNA uridine-5-carboxymethylaminomethyl(34) synthesis enzyme MnmG [Alphaproteobacteria bacterium]